MESYEVLIVGAGPAGSTCARLLAKGGLSVLLLDKDNFPRDKPCAGWITPAVLETLGIDPLRYRQGRLLQEIREFRTGIMYGKELVTDYGTTVSYGIRRSEFDHYLLLRSAARSMLGEAVTSLEQSADGWLVNGNIRARLLIGAGGHNCPVARVLGAMPGKEAAIVAMVAEFEMGEEQKATSPLHAGYTSLSFTSDFKGYGWLLRKGAFLNIGMGSLDKTALRRRTADFCAHYKRLGILIGDPSEHFKGHSYLSYLKQGGRRIVGDRALLIGDAAGLSFPESGEGILPAVESAFIAAQTVLCAWGEYRRENLEPYSTAVAARFASTAAGSGVLTLPADIKQMGARMLLSSGCLTRRLVLDHCFLHKGRRLLVSQLGEG
jgi:geranylgeranyl reductase family protein